MNLPIKHAPAVKEQTEVLKIRRKLAHAAFGQFTSQAIQLILILEHVNYALGLPREWGVQRTLRTAHQLLVTAICVEGSLRVRYEFHVL